MIMISSNFIFDFTNICVTVSYLTKFLTLAILFSTAVRAVLVSSYVSNIRYFAFNLICFRIKSSIST